MPASQGKGSEGITVSHDTIISELVSIGIRIFNPARRKRRSHHLSHWIHNDWRRLELGAPGGVHAICVCSNELRYVPDGNKDNYLSTYIPASYNFLVIPATGCRMYELQFSLIMNSYVYLVFDFIHVFRPSGQAAVPGRLI